MLTHDFTAVLDACVIVPLFLRDLLLRLAETPRLYIPKWSSSIMDEVGRTLTKPRIGLTTQHFEYQIQCMREAFPDAWVQGFERLIPAMPVNEKDRHVLAVAVKAHAETIVTFNVRHFPTDALAGLGIAAQTPNEFLVHQFHLNPELVVRKLTDQGASLTPARSLSQMLTAFQGCAPGFVQAICDKLSQNGRLCNHMVH